MPILLISGHGTTSFSRVIRLEFNINVPAHVLEVLWINYVFMRKAVRFR